KANPARQAKLIEGWAADPDAARLPLLEALRQGRVAADSAKNPFIQEADGYRALEGDAEPTGTPRKLRLNNRLRGLLDIALASHRLLATDDAERLAAAQELQRRTPASLLRLLNQRMVEED